MAREMAEQPARLQALITRSVELDERMRAVAPSPLNGITLVAEGSLEDWA